MLNLPWVWLECEKLERGVDFASGENKSLVVKREDGVTLKESGEGIKYRL